MASRSSVRLLEPLVAMLAVASIALLVALPGQGERATRDRDLMDGLGRLRTAVWHYGLDHRTPSGPALPGQDGTVETLIAQLTGLSDRDGRPRAVGDAAGGRYYGPYLEGVPTNPRNGLATIRVAPLVADRPEPDGSAGWIYLPRTGAVYPDLPWRDRDGVAYDEY